MSEEKQDIGSVIDSAFEEQPTETPVRETPEAGDQAHNLDAEGSTPSPATTQDEAEPEPEATEKVAPQAEGTDETDPGDLTKNLTPDQIKELRKADPKFDAIYSGLMKQYTPVRQELSQLRRLFGAIQNPETRKQALKALGAVVGAEIDLREEEKQEQQQASQVADTLSEEWTKVVGAEAAQMLRPLIEKTAQAAIQGQYQPLQQATEALQQDARNRQAQAQVAQFKALAKDEGWTVTPEVESKMFELGQQLQPAKAIETVEQGVDHLKMLYKLATADEALSNAEKRVLERMKKNADSTEPSRGVSSANREPKSRVDQAKDFDEALDIAMAEDTAGMRSAPSF